MEQNRGLGAGVLPLKILQIGCGALGVHLKGYLEESVSSFEIVESSSVSIPSIKGQGFDFVFLAVPDKALSKLVESLSESKNTDKTKLVHFSGFHYFKEALGLHPVASFSKKNSYDFQEISFVADGLMGEGLKKLFPKFQNIELHQKRDYHTYLSVVANSFQLFISQSAQEFEKDLGLDPNILREIVLQSLESEKKIGEASFSGPWVRGEKDFQDEHIKKMHSETLKNLNEAFVKEIKNHQKGRTYECSQI